MTDQPRYLLFDNQQLKAWRQCPRYWQYRHYFHKTRYTESSLAARFGQAVHKGLAVWYGQQSDDLAKMEALQCLNLSLDEQSEWRNEGKLVQILDMAMEKEFPCEVLAIGDEKLIEKPFSVPILDTEHYKYAVPGCQGLPLYRVLETLGYDEILYSGIIDLIGSNPQGNWVIDHKTTSLLRMTAPRGGTPFIGPAFWWQFDLSPQMTGYCFALTKLMNSPCQGFVINGLGSNTYHCVVERRFFTRTPKQIEEWRINRIKEIFEIVGLMWQFQNQGYPWALMNEDNCIKFNSKCEYSQLCECGNTELRNQLMANSYKDKPWDIFKRDEPATGD